MKLPQCLVLLMCAISILYSKEKSLAHRTKELMEKAKEEAQSFGWEMTDFLSEEIKKGDPQKGTFNFSPDDFLSEEDKGKRFDPILADNEGDVMAFLEAASHREKVNESEEFLSVSSDATINPHRELGIIGENTDDSSTGDELETCLESGVYQMFVDQNLIVDSSPAVTKQVIHCKGHEKKESFYWKNDAEKHSTSKQKKLEKDPKVASFRVRVTTGGVLKDYVVESKWSHLDGISCKRSWVETLVVQEASEMERWESEDPEVLSSLESNPQCRLLYSQILTGPETRTPNGVLVFRESWRRRLIFSCGDDQNSKCAQLRDAGAHLYKKRCLKEVPFNGGECDMWEKTYRIAGAVRNNAQVQFSGEDLWGISGSFSAGYESNGDFGTAVTTLAVFSDIKDEAEKSNTNFSGKKATIFKGEPRECQRSFIENVLYDCCSKMDGMAVASKLCRCTSEEKDLALKRGDGKCHFVGTYKRRLGSEKVQSFCCFPTKLARVIQEEGRKQLGLRWGSAENPNCSGLTIDQLRSIDFSLVDLSEAVEDISVDKEWIKRKIQDVTRDLQQGDKRTQIIQQSSFLAGKKEGSDD